MVQLCVGQKLRGLLAGTSVLGGAAASCCCSLLGVGGVAAAALWHAQH